MKQKALINSTDLTRYNPAGYRGRPLFYYHRQCSQLLMQRGINDLGLELAEAVSDDGQSNVDWYAPADQQQVWVCFTELDVAAQQAYQLRFERAWQALQTAYDDHCRDAGEHNFTAQMLAGVLSTSRPLDRCYVCGDELILTEWGLQEPAAKPQQRNNMRDYSDNNRGGQHDTESNLPPAPPQYEHNYLLWVFNGLVVLSLLCAVLAGVVYFVTYRPFVPFVETDQRTDFNRLTALHKAEANLRDQYDYLLEAYRSHVQSCRSCAADYATSEQATQKPSISVPDKQANLPSTPTEQTLQRPDQNAIARAEPDDQASFNVPEQARKEKDVAFLSGTWHSDTLQLSVWQEGHEDKIEKLPFYYIFHFDEQGEGTNNTLYRGKKNSCTIAVKVAFHGRDNIVIIPRGNYSCNKPDHVPPSPEINCSIAGDNRAFCYLYNKKNEKVNFILHPGEPS